MSVAQIIGIGARLFEAGLLGGEFSLGSTQVGKGGANALAFAAEPAIGVDELAMNIRIDQRAIVVLTMDFDEIAGNRSQALRAHRLIIDEGAGASVRHLHATQNEFAFGFDILGACRSNCRMIVGQLENRRHLALCFALTHERTVAARAEAQGERIEQDRFSGTRLAGKNGEAAAELEIEPVDQYNIANGKLNEHDGTLRANAESLAG